MFAGFVIMFVSTISKLYDVSIIMTGGAVVLKARIMNISVCSLNPAKVIPLAEKTFNWYSIQCLFILY